MGPSADSPSAALTQRYRIEREIGAGGMATVYLAEDLRHGRQVAIKILRREVAAAVGTARFLQEIRTVARLQHLHILGLLDSGEVDGTVYFVMPFVDGETLRQRLEREQQLPVRDAVRIATEVASALDYAHRHGVLHRDIKPENILLHDGRTLVADFGLALTSAGGGGTRITDAGLSVGTPQYMSPEQAMGERTITPRSDVYSLGVVTYEMLAGQPPFSGPNAQAIVARVLTDEPPRLATLRRRVPPGVETAVLTALEKLPADRWGTAAEFADALADGASAPAAAAPAVIGSPGRRFLAVIVAAVVLAAGLLLGRATAPRSALTGEVRATIPLGDSVVIGSVQSATIAIAPDGRRIAFAGDDGTGTAIWVRDLALDRPRMLAGTSSGVAPFFSPDGRFVGFLTGDGTRPQGLDLRVAPLEGGAVRTLVEGTATAWGADWGDDGYVYFAHPTAALARVPAEGGAVEQIGRLDANVEHAWPDVLPGSRFAVLTVWRGNVSSVRIALLDLKSGRTTDLAPGLFARYAPDGQLLVGTLAGEISALPIDIAGGRTTGPPVPVVAGVERQTLAGTVQFAASATGTLVYVPGDPRAAGLVWVDRRGRTTPVDSSLTGDFSDVALSPDGSRIAFSRTEGDANQVSVKELPDGALTRLSDADADRATWSPDGRVVAFLSRRTGARMAWARRADASDTLRALSPPGLDLDEVLFDPAGRWLLFRTYGSTPGTRRLLVMRPGVDAAPRALLASAADQYAATVSPDGRWIAYVSDETGRPEVSVRSFPNVDSARVGISVDGGLGPLWARDGRELYYRGYRGELYAVPTTIGSTFTHGPPQRLFANPTLAITPYFRTYAVAPGGRRFLMISASGEPTGTVAAIFNWQRALDRPRDPIRRR